MALYIAVLHFTVIIGSSVMTIAQSYTKMSVKQYLAKSSVALFTSVTM